MISTAKSITVFATAVLCIAPLAFIESDEPPMQELVIDDLEPEPDTETYESSIEIHQSHLCLDHEVIQYKFLFHDNATVTVDARVAYIIRDLKPVAYLFYLTDGEKRLTNFSYCTHVPTGTILDITTRRNHFKIGGRLLYRLINIGRDVPIDKTFSVASGDEWYLTIGVYRSIKEEEIFFKLKSNKPCIEIIPLERHDKIGYFSSWNNDFSGTYIGFKLPFLPFGFSFADSLEKEITTTRGTIVSFLSVAHLKGKIVVRLPEGSFYSNSDRWSAGFSYEGNNTGTWAFKASGIGFPWKHIVMLFYADVNPHIQSEIDGCGFTGKL